MTVSKTTRIFYVSEILFQQILAVFVLLILWELIKFGSISSKATWHIVLCVLGFALLMAEGVQIYRKESIVSFGETRVDKVKAHGIIMLLSFLCITAGIALKISQKEDALLDHFTTTHGKLGLSAWVLAFLAGLGGVISSQCSFAGKDIIKLVHLLVGVTAYLLGIITLGYGLSYMTLGENGRIFLIILLAIYVCYSLIGPCLSIVNRLKR